MSELGNLVGRRVVNLVVEGKEWGIYVPSFRLAGVISKIEDEEKDTFVRMARTLWELGRRTEGWVDKYTDADALLDALDMDDLTPLLTALKSLQEGTVKAAQSLGMNTEAPAGGAEPFQPAGGGGG